MTTEVAFAERDLVVGRRSVALHVADQDGGTPGGPKGLLCRRQVEAQQVVAGHHHDVLAGGRDVLQREGDVAHGAEAVALFRGAVVEDAHRDRAVQLRRPGLELRGELENETWERIASRMPRGALLVGLTSIHWREAWKYGERAFRYCQHDVGHGLGALALAAACAPDGSGSGVPTHPGDTYSVTLEWDAPTTDAVGRPLEDLFGYNLYYWETESAAGSETMIELGAETGVTVPGLYDMQLRAMLTAARSCVERGIVVELEILIVGNRRQGAGLTGNPRTMLALGIVTPAPLDQMCIKIDQSGPWVL